MLNSWPGYFRNLPHWRTLVWMTQCLQSIVLIASGSWLVLSPGQTRAGGEGHPLAANTHTRLYNENVPTRPPIPTAMDKFRGNACATSAELDAYLNDLFEYHQATGTSDRLKAQSP